MIIAVIGDRERVDLKALKAVGEVHEVKLEDIVSYGAFPEWVETPKATTEQP